jgi:hypothetical protein
MIIKDVHVIFVDFAFCFLAEMKLMQITEQIQNLLLFMKILICNTRKLTT